MNELSYFLDTTRFRAKQQKGNGRTIASHLRRWALAEQRLVPNNQR